MNILFAIIMMGCRHDPKVEESGDAQPQIPAMSECGQLVLEEGTPTAFDDCFEGQGDTGWSCETCGYYSDVALSQGAFDCITCYEGYEIDVVFPDCTGFCVPEGTAEDPIGTNECVPVSDCVRD
tara:strand:- start:2100 stop:2471 length:372 start_codon:yes stop_codon:yes gene_type:complete